MLRYRTHDSLTPHPKQHQCNLQLALRTEHCTIHTCLIGSKVSPLMVNAQWLPPPQPREPFPCPPLCASRMYLLRQMHFSPKKELMESFPYKNKHVGVSTHHQVGNNGSDFQYLRKISISHVPSNGTELTRDFELAR